MSIALSSAHRPRRRRPGLGTWLGRLCLTLFLAVWMVPLYWLVNTTFKFKSQIQSDMPVWLPNPPTMINIDWVIHNLDPAALQRSLHVVAISVVFSVIFGPLMAYALSRFPSRYNRQLENWIISTRMMPPAALIMPFYFLFLRVHLLNTELGLTLLYIAVNLPLTSWIMLAYLRSLPEDAEEAARIDGCLTLGRLLPCRAAHDEILHRGGRSACHHPDLERILHRLRHHLQQHHVSGAGRGLSRQWHEPGIRPYGRRRGSCCRCPRC